MTFEYGGFIIGFIVGFVIGGIWFTYMKRLPKDMINWGKDE